MSIGISNLPQPQTTYTEGSQSADSVAKVNQQIIVQSFAFKETVIGAGLTLGGLIAFLIYFKLVERAEIRIYAEEELRKARELEAKKAKEAKELEAKKAKELEAKEAKEALEKALVLNVPPQKSILKVSRKNDTQTTRSAENVQMQKEIPLTHHIPPKSLPLRKPLPCDKLYTAYPRASIEYITFPNRKTSN